MKATLPVKILLLAATNLLLLLVIAAIFLRLPSRLSWDALVLAPSQDRILSAARGFALDLQRTPISQRDSLLDPLRKQFGAEVYLFEKNGDEVAGKPVELPEQVRKAFNVGVGNRGLPPPPSPDDFARDQPGVADPPGGMPPPDAPPGAPGRGFQSGVFRQTPISSFTDGDHRRHWVGVDIPIASPDDDLRPGALILTTDSWFSGSLFFDFRPWLAAMAAVLLATLVCWAPFLRNLARSIREITVATEDIAEGQFDVQLRETRTDELGQLSQAIQRMSSRLAQLVHGQKRFLGDVAHELCSPISRMQFALGILERDVPESKLADLNDEIQQMSSLVQELLQFSKASIQQPGRPLETVNLSETAQSAAQREGIAIQLQVDPALRAQADSAALSRALSNLIRNAWRYAGDAGPIEVAAYTQNGHVRLRVSDHGPGMPEAELDRVTAPFYRPELARTRESGGVGLGLAIVKTCIDACQGTVRLRNRQPHGLEVEITLKSI